MLLNRVTTRIFNLIREDLVSELKYENDIKKQSVYQLRNHNSNINCVTSLEKEHKRVNEIVHIH